MVVLISFTELKLTIGQPFFCLLPFMSSNLEHFPGMLATTLPTAKLAELGACFLEAMGASDRQSAPKRFGADLQLAVSHRQRLDGGVRLNSKFGMTRVYSTFVNDHSP